MAMKRFARWGDPEIHQSLVAFLQLGTWKPGPHSLPGDIDLYATFTPGAPLAIVFHGRIDREKAAPPIFSGFHVATGMSRLCISDPSLYLDPSLMLGWYAGHRGLPLQETLHTIIDRAIEVAQPSKVLFVGGSGGGFASLYYARHFPASTVIVWNPQTNILNYHPKFVAAYTKAAWGMGLEEAQERLHEQICVDVAPLYRSPGPKVLYLQNRSDNHVEVHMKPFLKATGERRSDVLVHLGNWGNGHVAPPKALLRALISRMAKSDWENAARIVRKSELVAAEAADN